MWAIIPVSPTLMAMSEFSHMLVHTSDYQIAEYWNFANAKPIRASYMAILSSLRHQKEAASRDQGIYSR
jgi:hypothetical protein